MPEYRAAYQGDEALGRLLRQAGSRYGVADLPALLAGVAGAPDADDPTGWIDLVAANAGDALKAQLQAYRAEKAEKKASAAGPAESAARVAVLRTEMQRRGLTGFIVPRADEHQGEYVPPPAERLAWLPRVTGPAALAIALQ